VPCTTALDPTPVAGVSMGAVSLLRLDRMGGSAPGNKWYKLRGSLAVARQHGIRRLVSFGGPWSNHLHALAAVGHEHGYETVGIVRGETGPLETAMLADARAWGMQVIAVSRSEYRLRNDPDYLERLGRQFDPCLVIPEGGANTLGASGCKAIAELVETALPGPARVVLAVGTGTTLAGIVAGLGSDYEVLGVSALKGAVDLEQRVSQALEACSRGPYARWSILHEYHCGGFARTSPDLQHFMLQFERIQGIELEPVYTGKMLFALHQLLGSGQWNSDTPIVAIHTGGLQGRRGYGWLMTPGGIDH
jgi:1-aminocyclopropane-1-carboxylate deaminase/D-cysteine desulfhydrase-like pyridoxal-dependent ACC family enzyme